MSGKALDILLLKLKNKNPANLKATSLEGNADLLAFELLLYFKHLFTDVILQLIFLKNGKSNRFSLFWWRKTESKSMSVPAICAERPRNKFESKSANHQLTN